MRSTHEEDYNRTEELIHSFPKFADHQETPETTLMDWMRRRECLYLNNVLLLPSNLNNEHVLERIQNSFQATDKAIVNYIMTCCNQTGFLANSEKCTQNAAFLNHCNKLNTSNHRSDFIQNKDGSIKYIERFYISSYNKMTYGTFDPESTKSENESGEIAIVITTSIIRFVDDKIEHEFNTDQIILLDEKYKEELFNPNDFIVTIGATSKEAINHYLHKMILNEIELATEENLQVLLFSIIDELKEFHPDTSNKDLDKIIHLAKKIDQDASLASMKKIAHSIHQKCMQQLPKVGVFFSASTETDAHALASSDYSSFLFRAIASAKHNIKKFPNIANLEQLLTAQKNRDALILCHQYISSLSSHSNEAMSRKQIAACQQLAQEIKNSSINTDPSLLIQTALDKPLEDASTELPPESLRAILSYPNKNARLIIKDLIESLERIPSAKEIILELKFPKNIFTAHSTYPAK
jgi:hypothetical protein